MSSWTQCFACGMAGRTEDMDPHVCDEADLPAKGQVRVRGELRAAKTLVERDAAVKEAEAKRRLGL